MLSDVQVKALKPKDKRYTKSDGEGLNILILPTGKKKWVLSYRINQKQSQKMIGDFPNIGCKEARQLARGLKDKLQGKDKPTLKMVSDEWLAMMQPQWTSQKYIDTVIYRINYISQGLEHLPVDDIQRRQISDRVKTIVAQGTLETATRCLRLLNAIFNFAIASDYTDRNPCALVADIIPENDVRPMPCLPVAAMPEFFKRIEQCRLNLHLHHALLLSCYCATRISELLNARWDSGEFDWDNRIWTVPAHRMKKRKDLMIPMVPQIYELFYELYERRTDDGLVFKNRNNPQRPMPSESVLAVIKRNGYAGEMVTHGFRSLFSTHANESKLFRHEVIDVQIAHVNKSTTADRTSKIYNRAEYWPERVELMTWYANEVDIWRGIKKGA